MRNLVISIFLTLLTAFFLVGCYDPCESQYWEVDHGQDCWNLCTEYGRYTIDEIQCREGGDCWCCYEGNCSWSGYTLGED